MRNVRRGFDRGEDLRSVRKSAAPRLRLVRYCHDTIVAQRRQRKVWEGETPSQFRGLDFAWALDLLSALNVASTLQDLSPLKSLTAQAQGRPQRPMGYDCERTLAHLLCVQEGRRSQRRDHRLPQGIAYAIRNISRRLLET